MKKKIFIVEDEKNIRDLLSRKLISNGFETKLFNNGAEIIFKLSQGNLEIPDLILTDIMMPKVDGLELLDFLSIEYPFIPKVVFSGLDSLKVIEYAKRSGSTHFVSKLTDLDVLCQNIFEILEEKNNHNRISVIGFKPESMFQISNLKEIEEDSYKFNSKEYLELGYIMKLGKRGAKESVFVEILERLELGTGFHYLGRQISPNMNYLSTIGEVANG